LYLCYICPIRNNARSKAQWAVVTAEEKLVWWEKQNEKDWARRAK